MSCEGTNIEAEYILDSGGNLVFQRAVDFRTSPPTIITDQAAYDAIPKFRCVTKDLDESVCLTTLANVDAATGAAVDTSLVVKGKKSICEKYFYNLDGTLDSIETLSVRLLECLADGTVSDVTATHAIVPCPVSEQSIIEAACAKAG